MMSYKASRNNETLIKFMGAEQPEKLAQCKRILSDLLSKDWIPTAHFRLFAYQYNARIKELRDGLYDGKNHIIRSEKRDGVWGFVYGGFLQRK